jgi:putative drug exporter of the RND superfamily
VRMRLVPSRMTYPASSPAPATGYARFATPQKRSLIPQDLLVRLKLIPSRKTHPASTPPPATSDAALATPRDRSPISEDLLVRLKLIPSRKNQRSPSQPPAASDAPLTDGHTRGKHAKTSDVPATTSGELAIDCPSEHPLPLFDLNGLPAHLTSDLRASASDSATTSNGNGKQKIDRYLGHALPLFGLNVRSLPPITIRANGNGHASGTANGNGHATGTANGNRHSNGNGNGNGDQPTDHDLGQALPLFGPNTGP